MEKNELIKLKTILESPYIARCLQESINPNNFISNIINYIILTKDYDDIEKNLSSDLGVYLEYFNRFNDVSYEKKLYTNFSNDGYLYHITGVNRIPQILDKGILTLSSQFGQDIYYDCRNLNKIFHRLQSANKSRKYDIIDIPNNKLYKKRFNSIYLTMNLERSIPYYKNGNEFFRRFIWEFDDGEFNTGRIEQQDELLHKIISSSQKKYNISDEDISFLIEFYNKYFDVINEREQSYGIVLVPNQFLKEQKKLEKDLLYKYSIRKLSKHSDSFKEYIKHCDDIEYNDNISPEGLIGISVNDNKNIKVYSKKI